MHHPGYKASKAPVLLLLMVLSLYSLSSCGTNSGSSTLHINDKLRAGGIPVPGKSQTSFVPPTGHKERAELTDPVLNASVTFDSSVTYEHALRSITNLGLQISAFCAEENIPWRPVGNEDSFNSTHYMQIESTPLAPPGWLDRLKAIPGVQSVQEESGIVFCPHLVQASPGTTAFLQREQVGTYVSVTFGSSVNSYETALAAISNLGFRLGNPCFEQAKGTKPAWTPMGQEDMFTNTHTLILVTTYLNSNHWQGQLQAVAGVTQVETTFDVKC